MENVKNVVQVSETDECLVFVYESNVCCKRRISLILTFGGATVCRVSPATNVDGFEFE